jgi:hypothetical protein
MQAISYVCDKNSRSTQELHPTICGHNVTAVCCAPVTSFWPRFVWRTLGMDEWSSCDGAGAIAVTAMHSSHARRTSCMLVYATQTQITQVSGGVAAASRGGLALLWSMCTPHTGSTHPTAAPVPPRPVAPRPVALSRVSRARPLPGPTAQSRRGVRICCGDSIILD